MMGRKKGLIPVMFVFIFIFISIITLGQKVYSKGSGDETFRKLLEKGQSEEENRGSRWTGDTKNPVKEAGEIDEGIVKKDEIVKKSPEARDRVEEKIRHKRNGKNSKIVYLTFDDGPSKKITPEVLDILKKYNIKASFFVLGSSAEKNPKLLKRIREDGHAIYNHSYSHNYREIYSRPKNFISEIKRTDEIIDSIIGKNSFKKIIRFPGGSFGENRAEFRKAAADEGYVYIDWNAENGDGLKNNIPVKNLIKEVKKTAEGKGELVILMHDSNTKATTAKALPETIEYLISKGYRFSTLEDYEF